MNDLTTIKGSAIRRQSIVSLLRDIADQIEAGEFDPDNFWLESGVKRAGSEGGYKVHEPDGKYSLRLDYHRAVNGNE